jgi:hypothetical protein
VRDRQLHLVVDQRLADGGLEQFDLERGVVGDAEGADLPGGLERVEGLGDLVGLHERVGAVQQQHVQVLGVQGREGLVHRGEEVLLREVEEGVADAHLALDDDLLALGGRELDGLAEAGLAAVAGRAVDVGVVEDVDPGVAGRTEEGADVLVRHLGDAHQPEDDVGGTQGGPGDRERFHSVLPACRVG